jgi:cell wall-associated NlpC family hydrolase
MKSIRNNHFVILLYLFVIILIFITPKLAFAIGESDDDILSDVEQRYDSNENQPYSPETSSFSLDSDFAIELLTFEKNITPGDKFACIISYSNSSQLDSNNTTLTLSVPNKLRCIDFYDHNLNTVEYTLDSVDDRLNYSFNVGLVSPNEIGNVVAVVKYADYDEVIDIPLTLSSSVQSDNLSPAQSEAFSINPADVMTDWAVLAYKETSADNPLVDSDTLYGISLFGNSADVNIDLNNVTLSFNYPVNAIVTNSDGGTVDANNYKISWNIPVLLAGETVERSVTIKYPSQYFCGLDDIQNGKSSSANIAVTATSTLPNTNTVIEVSDFIHHAFTKPIEIIGTPENYKALDKTEYTVDEQSIYTVYGVENKQNVDFAKLNVIYTVPAKTKLDYIQTGAFNYDVNVIMYYKYKGESNFRPWDASSYTQNKKLLLNSLPDSENIDQIKWAIREGNQKIGPGFTANNTIKAGSTVGGSYGDIFEVSSTITATTTSGNILESECKDKYEVYPIFPENLSEKRKKIVKTAFSLVGKVEYFWGGKSTVVGWDDRWNVMTYNDFTNRIELNGMDCSGYTQWVYINSDFSISYVTSNFGNNTIYQWPTSQAITSSEVLPGDLAFRQPPTVPGINHVGIFVGKDSQGRDLVAHCSGAYNNVVVTPYSPTFYYTRRPNILLDYPN